ncbi:MAG: hypothetical protein ACK4V6_10515 [Microthrixaceae bacterium]
MHRLDDRPAEASARSLLGLAPGASGRTVVEAHRRYVREHHPDAGGAAGDLDAARRARDLLLRNERTSPHVAATRRTFHRRTPWWHRLNFWRSA